MILWNHGVLGIFFQSSVKNVKRVQLLLCPPPDPDVPQDFRMTSWNSSSVSLAWAYPGDHVHFLLTAFYLNGTDRVINKESIWHKEANLELTMSNLPACSRVKFGLQAVCQEGMDSHYSSMVKHDGNSRKASTRSRPICVCESSQSPRVSECRRVKLRCWTGFAILKKKNLHNPSV